MNEDKTNEIINKIFLNIFDQENHFSLKELKEKFAFDISLPRQVIDVTSNEITWTDSLNNTNFITNKNMLKHDQEQGWMLPKKNISNLSELLTIWQTINLTTTERVYDSINVVKSDTIYNCENIYQSTDCRFSNNLIFCDSCGNSSFLMASKRSNTCNFSIRCDDSKNCNNCYNIICSNQISNSFFIQDCSNLYECMFCSHIASKKFCIANMQFSESEYYIIKKQIMSWIINSQ